MKRIETEAEAKAFIQAMKKEHWKQTITVALSFSVKKMKSNASSDDGEPVVRQVSQCWKYLKKMN